jgi:phenylalanyl-tRNA synthetase beta chain
MLAMGFSEAISFAFIEEAAAAPFLGSAAAVRIANPLSETFAVMRPSVLPGVIDAVGHNRRHERRDVRLFEIATAFGPAGERRALAAAWTGTAGGDHGSGGRREVDFYDVKGVAQQVCAALGVEAAFAVADYPYLVAGRTAAIAANGHAAGVVGLLAPALAEARAIPRGDAVFVLELDLDVLTATAATAKTRVEPLPRFPSVVRDVALLVDDSLSAATVRDTIRAAAPATLVSVREFDRFQGRDMPAGMVSLALRLTFRAADRTLTDDEVSSAMGQIVATVTTTLGAIQR